MKKRTLPIAGIASILSITTAAAIACVTAVTGIAAATVVSAAAGVRDAAAPAAQSSPAAQPASSPHLWAGVWQAKQAGKPGVTITLADDSGALAGTIVFEVMNRQTGERIAIEPRTVVNPHMEDGKLAFQVRRILKPHLQGDPPASEEASDPKDIVDMTLTPTGEGKATLTCPKCGEASPTEVTKAE